MAKRGPKPKDDEAALRAMADLIVNGDMRPLKRGKSEGITRAARLVAEVLEPTQSKDAEIDRLRRAYRVKRTRLERDARRRRKIKIGRAYQADGLPALRRARETSLFAPSVYFKSHDAEPTRKQAAKIAIIAETAVSIAAKTLIPAIRRSATSAELRQRSKALEKILETVMRAMRDMGRV